MPHEKPSIPIVEKHPTTASSIIVTLLRNRFTCTVVKQDRAPLYKHYTTTHRHPALLSRAAVANPPTPAPTTTTRVGFPSPSEQASIPMEPTRGRRDCCRVLMACLLGTKAVKGCEVERRERHHRGRKFSVIKNEIDVFFIIIYCLNV